MLVHHVFSGGLKFSTENTWLERNSVSSLFEKFALSSYGWVIPLRNSLIQNSGILEMIQPSAVELMSELL